MIIETLAALIAGSTPPWARFFVENAAMFSLLWKASLISFVLLIIWQIISILINRKQKTLTNSDKDKTEETPPKSTIETVPQPADDPWKALLQEGTSSSLHITPIQLEKQGFFSSSTSKPAQIEDPADRRSPQGGSVADGAAEGGMETYNAGIEFPLPPETTQSSSAPPNSNQQEIEDPWKKLMKDSVQSPPPIHSREIPLSIELEQLTSHAPEDSVQPAASSSTSSADILLSCLDEKSKNSRSQEP